MTTHMKDYNLLLLDEFFFAPGACAPAPCGGSPLQGDGGLARCCGVVLEY